APNASGPRHRRRTEAPARRLARGLFRVLREVDDERGVVRRDAGVGRRLTRVAIALDRQGPSGKRLSDVHVIDAHPEVLVEVTGAVVPPGVEAGLGVELANHVDEAPIAHPRDGVALRR